MNAIGDNREHKIEFIYVIGQEHLEEVRQLFSEYANSLEIDLSFQNFSEEMKTLPGKYGPPEGSLIIASVDGKSVGCVALRKISEDICEMKRLYVRDSCRGLGIGKKLISIIIGEAAKRKYSYIRLDTLSTMEKALNLYRYYGFYEIEPYIYNPIQGARFLELKI